MELQKEMELWDSQIKPLEAFTTIEVNKHKIELRLWELLVLQFEYCKILI